MKKEILGTLYKGFLTVRRIAATIKGKERAYELLDIKGAVAGLVIDENGKIGLVHQYRPAADQVTIEIPAGTLDKEGASHYDVLFGELEEEMGIRWEETTVRISPHPILEYYMMVGCCNGKMAVYLINVAAQQDRESDDSDVIRTEWVTLETFGRYIAEGKIVDGKSIMAYWYLRANPELLAA